ncbi:hypothetical protein [Kribbella sp. NPDC048928]|uniref:hypothetical protein n=1 Tax=Kribbella sp. NPDC048928 TaxID=3364111 RepID=UPI00371E7868
MGAAVTLDAIAGSVLEHGCRTFPIEIIADIDVPDTVVTTSVTAADERTVTLKVTKVVGERDAE